MWFQILYRYSKYCSSSGKFHRYSWYYNDYLWQFMSDEGEHSQSDMFLVSFPRLTCVFHNRWSMWKDGVYSRLPVSPLAINFFQDSFQDALPSLAPSSSFAWCTICPGHILRATACLFPHICGAPQPLTYWLWEMQFDH